LVVLAGGASFRRSGLIFIFSHSPVQVGAQLFLLVLAAGASFARSHLIFMPTASFLFSWRNRQAKRHPFLLVLATGASFRLIVLSFTALASFAVSACPWGTSHALGSTSVGASFPRNRLIFMHLASFSFAAQLALVVLAGGASLRCSDLIRMCSHLLGPARP
jgi:hypothetical protein